MFGVFCSESSQMKVESCPLLASCKPLVSVLLYLSHPITTNSSFLFTIHRTQLDMQRRETERLQKQLLGDLPSFQSISGPAAGMTSHSAGQAQHPSGSHSVVGHNLSGSSNNSSTNNISGSGGHLFPQAFSPSKAAFSTVSASDLMAAGLPQRRNYDYQPPYVNPISSLFAC